METGSILEIAAGMATGIVGYFVRIHNKRIDKIEDDQKLANNRLHDHELYSEKSYAKEETVQHSLKRLYDQMEKGFDGFDLKVERGFSELREDIKSLIKGRP